MLAKKIDQSQQGLGGGIRGAERRQTRQNPQWNLDVHLDLVLLSYAR